MPHRPRGDLICEPHARDLLVGLDCPRLVQQRRRVGRSRKGVEPGYRVRRRLAHHPVRRLRAEAQLEADALELVRRPARDLERTYRGRSRVGGVVARHEPNVLRPRRLCRIMRGGLDRDQDRIAFAREHRRVEALHAPEVRQVEDVVGSPHDERVELLLGHQRAHALEFRVVARPAHERTRSGAGAPCASCQETTGFRSTPIFSISASITSPGFR